MWSGERQQQTDLLHFKGNYMAYTTAIEKGLHILVFRVGKVAGLATKLQRREYSEPAAQLRSPSIVRLLVEGSENFQALVYG